MATLMDELEVTIIKPDKMYYSWSFTLKICVLTVVAFALYMYLYLYVKELWAKSKQLDRIGMLTIKTDKMMKHIFIVDQNISIFLEELSNKPY